MNEFPLGAAEKALRMNHDATVYGTFAEIGAGQEVVGWFFHVGGASGTVAKTISAYDMVVSDAIYGHCDRYVSRKRLEAMLTYEYNLLLERLGPLRGDRSAFFVFADTAATHSRRKHERGHGWLGVRFQTAPRAEPSQIILHVISHDNERTYEREAIGLLGVNLLHGAVYQHGDLAEFLNSLMDNLTRERVEIDMIKFSGPAFAGVDNRLMSLRLVEHAYTDATMFTAEGEVVQPAEMLYQRPILVERGRFRPVNLLTKDLLEKAVAQFRAEPELKGEEPAVLMEVTLRDLALEEGVDERDFLDRIDTLRVLGQPVLISNHGPYYRLVEHLNQYTRKNIGIAVGVPALNSILDEKHYEDLAGGALEAVGRLFARNVRMYVYPRFDAASGETVSAETLTVATRLRHLYTHLLENRHLVSIEACNPDFRAIDSDQVLRQIQAGDPAWEQSVPPPVAELIQQRHLFGWSSAPRPEQTQPGMPDRLADKTSP
jgi:hypothetical protein